MSELFLAMEALYSTALSHRRGCGCDVCSAAHGDLEAMARCLLEMKAID